MGGGGEQRAEWQDIVVKRSDDVDLKHRPQHQSAPHNSLLYKIWRFILVCIELLELFNQILIYSIKNLFNGVLLLVAVLVGPGFLLLMLKNCYNSNDVEISQVVYHFFPFIETWKNKIETAAETAQDSFSRNLQSAEGEREIIFQNVLIKIFQPR